MRWSQLFIPTLREAPADAQATNHTLLIRGGFIRQLHSGHYSLLPLGLRVHEKVAAIVRREMEAIGAQEFLLPAMHPAEIWKKSGRWQAVGEELFRLVDRKGADNVLGMTHEEVFAEVAKEITSYKALPQIWFQIQWKFRDEPRPKGGLLRVREFAMKDSYSFDVDEAGLDSSFDAHRRAYERIFAALGLPTIAVQASSGAMGGSGSTEFMVPSPAGEDDIALCRECGYASNLERAQAQIAELVDRDLPDLMRFPTPGVRTIAALETVAGGATAVHQIKTMVMVLDGEVTLALLRGDHELELQKLADYTGAADVRPATPDEALKWLGAHPGSLGAVHVEDLRIICDPALRGRRGLTTGANEDDWHFSGVDVARDIAVDDWADLRRVKAAEPCVVCGMPLEVLRCIEAGHIFKLGTKYSSALGAFVLDRNGKQTPLVMGSYGIGIGRNLAAVAEVYHDDKGLVWPLAVAPFDVVITILNLKDAVSRRASETLYQDLLNQGIDVLLDDRGVRAGVKFADAELIGVPYRVTIGPRALAEGEVEITTRSTNETLRCPIGLVVEHLNEIVNKQKR
ncbi:MAG: proline--tRNA ligase [Acidimicrobiia bacterium]|nr:proline--tRNA ligase [Acidimicrobiia bacterium]MCY4458213.1 proline--tRNA ligase [Acidimicrobiaceae bacterium]